MIFRLVWATFGPLVFIAFGASPLVACGPQSANGPSGGAPQGADSGTTDDADARAPQQDAWVAPVGTSYDATASDESPSPMESGASDGGPVATDAGGPVDSPAAGDGYDGGFVMGGGKRTSMGRGP